MEKTFTINVPDEIWVKSWENNITETYTYSGPASIKVLVETIGDWEVLDWSETDFDRELQSHEHVIDLDVTDENVEIAYWLTTDLSTHEYTYEDVENHDGSVYKKITNPTIRDYFDIAYKPSTGFSLNAIYKEAETENEKSAKERRDYVRKYNDLYDFDTDNQTLIDNFLTAVDNYINNMETVYPWKYVTIDKQEVPKIPASLISTFSSLPEID